MRTEDRISEEIPNTGKVELYFGVTIHNKKLLTELARLSRQAISDLEE